MPSSRPIDDLFTFTLRAGSMLLRNGSPSANVTQAMLTITRVNGFATTTANVTMGQITLSYTPADDATPVTRVQTVGAAGLDVHVLTVLEHIVEDVVTSRIDIREALRRLDELEAEPPQTRTLKTLGTAAMGFGFAWLLGGSLGVCLVATVCAVIIDVVSAWLARVQLPSYYGRAIAAGLAVATGAVLVAVFPIGSPGVIITAALVTQLAGSASVSAIQDLLTGWYLTACGRLIESTILTLGLVVGAIGAVYGVAHVGVHLDIEKTGNGNPVAWQTTLAAALIAIGFALLSHARWRHLPLFALLGAAARAIYLLLSAAGISNFTATSVAAMGLGIVSVVMARPTHLPTSGALDVAISPLVPGMVLYKGFAALATHSGSAGAYLFEAMAVALAIGTGAVLGQFIASRSLWSARSVQYKHASQHGDADLDDTEFAAKGLSTPDFRRPFIDHGGEAPRG